jgi:DNA-binding MarR family transcriptional regulator
MYKNNMDYHLRNLEKQGLIKIINNNGYARYYATKLDGERAKSIANLFLKNHKQKGITLDMIFSWFKFGIPSKEEKEIINLFRCNIPWDIIRYLWFKPNSSKNDLSKYLKKHRTTITYHLNKLIEADLLVKSTKSNESKFKLKDPERVLEIFKWAFSHKLKIKKDYNQENIIEYTIVDKIIKETYEIFPHPYHI